MNFIVTIIQSLLRSLHLTVSFVMPLYEGGVIFALHLSVGWFVGHSPTFCVMDNQKMLYLTECMLGRLIHIKCTMILTARHINILGQGHYLARQVLCM